jgi:hypothetical protein
MEGAGLVLDALGRVRDMMREAPKDLSPEELLAPLKPQSPGWFRICLEYRTAISPV